ncbi:MAG: zinc-dependent metalloprotease [Gammaproteobacteria bacterium]|nr:zinc-dependent metalloprotease [Gammaproteobacteria bacterium]
MFGRIFAALASVVLILPSSSVASDIDLQSYQHIDGFVDLYWDAGSGRLLMRLDALDTPFIYQASLPRGVGSNDIGLDRGQLGDTKVVRFLQSGPKVLLLEDNLAYRADSDNQDERDAIRDSFASSVIWGFVDLDPANDSVVVDATEFFVRDAHGVSGVLSDRAEGAYAVDASRSAVFMERTRGFPDNTEVEAIVTFTGVPTGQFLPSVTPDAETFSVHIHHSFIRLPDNNYEPLPYDPRAGVIGLSYDSSGFSNYATPIGENIAVDYGRRHRLKKKDPTAEFSEAVEPIIYYLDRGAPEPVRSALLEGASWWNQAYEAAGYKDAFQVKMLPEDADPMDVRYNVIQWVHRSTRGWSYGSSILDPRTGEILKGHVTLGSLRVRQDYLIAEGLLAPYADGAVPDDMLEMSLARIRQLSAHEVGHTIGFEHNFAASTQDRSSVMDYPVPLIRIRDDGSFDLSEAYGDGIGSWDIRTVLYAYQDFPPGVDANAERARIVAETIAAGFKYVADTDARSASTAHPDGNLWDNGKDALEELAHLRRVRGLALENFSERTIRPGRPLAQIEEVLVPVYLLHRFQIEAVGKLIGGQYFDYNLRGDGQPLPTKVAAERQVAAIDALLATLDPAFLRLSDELLASIPPRVPNNPKSRETFRAATGVTFDGLAPAASSVALTLNVLLEPRRAARMVRGDAPGFASVTTGLMDSSWYARQAGGMTGLIQRQTNMQVLYGLLGLAYDASADNEVRALALETVRELENWLSRQSSREIAWRAHYAFARSEIERLRHDPTQIESLTPLTIPPGSPIGSFAPDTLQ